MKQRHKSNVEQVRRVLAAASKIQTRVGFFPNQTYADGTPVAYVATVQEFGYGPIPARSFMRLTSRIDGPKWQANVQAALASAIRAGSVEKLKANFDQVGAVAAADISHTISQIQSPPLAASTLAARQSKKKTPGVSSKPLVDSGKLIQSPTFVTVFA